MDSRQIFPNELWLEVTAHLPPPAVRNLSSTHRALYDIARSLGFTELKLYPYPYDLQPLKEQIDDALQRLSFYSSPKTAPNVRSCTARSHYERWQGSAQLDDEKSPHILMNAFSNAFPNSLDYSDCTLIEFSSRSWGSPTCASYRRLPMWSSLGVRLQLESI
jgi:hypothetical protein